MKNRSLFIVAILLLMLAAPTQAADAPDEVVRQFVDYFYASDWENVVSLIDPEELADIKGTLLPIFAVEGANVFIELVFGEGSTFEDLQEESDAVFYAKIMQFFKGAFQELVSEEHALRSLEIIGSVPEDPDVLHFVVRATVSRQGATISELQLVSVRLGQEGWGVMLGAEVGALARTIGLGLSGGLPH